MNENLVKEINYLTRLIELHQQKHPERLVHNMKAFQNQELSLEKSDRCTNLIYRPHSSVMTSIADSYRSEPSKCQINTNVHINPNFKPHNPIIHINPKVRLKPLVHVNPKMIGDVANSNKDVETKHVMAATNSKQNVTQTDIKRSVYVNPKLMKRLSSMTESKSAENKQTTIQGSAYSVCSRLKFVKSTNSPKVNQKKANNSNVVILSRRKLIRVRRGSKGPSNTSQIGLYKIKNPLTLPFNKSKINTSKIIKTKLTNVMQQSIIQNCSLVKLPVKPKINKYRIDRTTPENARTKKRVPSSSKKITNNMTELITIGGIVYKSSKNQLVRKSYGLKKKRVTNAKVDKFVIATNGKKLCRLKCTKEMVLNADTAMRSGRSEIKSSSNILQKVNYKNNISNKVKQRSIQILRNKMRKNNQPCLIFQRFGFCANYEKGTCPKLHDKKQISLCKKFLQGNCLLDKCPLSHDVGPEKMPTCKYFLEGCCMRDACPYRHIKVSSNTPICIEFLKGYCAKGHECKRRHENLCPEFAKAGRCSKGKYCPYPHKLNSTAFKQTDKYLNRKHDVPIDQTALATNSSGTNHENRVRYYEQTDTLNEDFEKKKESIMRKIQIMKHVETVAQCNEIVSSETSCKVNDTCPLKAIKGNTEPQVAFENKVLQRPPIGALPAYIPID